MSQYINQVWSEYHQHSSFLSLYSPTSYSHVSRSDKLRKTIMRTKHRRFPYKSILHSMTEFTFINIFNIDKTTFYVLIPTKLFENRLTMNNGSHKTMNESNKVFLYFQTRTLEWLAV